MNKILFLVIALILFACTPPVTELPTVTLAPPTETPIPTPTLHPQFIELQNLINDSGERFTLLPDGTFEEVTTDGTHQTIPNLQVDQNGVINIIFNNEHVVIEQSQISFDDENGLIIEGYELNENGQWVEAISKSMQETNKLIETYNLADAIEAGEITATEERGAVNVTDNETGRILIRVIGETSKYDMEFAIKRVAANSCESTDIEPNSSGYLSQDSLDKFNEYRELLFAETSFAKPDKVGKTVYAILVDEEKQCWGVTDGVDFAFRDKNKVAIKLALFEATREEIRAIQAGK